jgi:hypothetical protein
MEHYYWMNISLEILKYVWKWLKEWKMVHKIY